MSHAPQTPQRPLPGTYFSTPTTLRAAPRGGAYSQQNGLLSQAREALPPASSAETFAEVSFAAKTINEKLEKDANFPELDNYIGRKFGQRRRQRQKAMLMVP